MLFGLTVEWLHVSCLPITSSIDALLTVGQSKSMTIFLERPAVQLASTVDYHIIATQPRLSHSTCSCCCCCW